MKKLNIILSCVSVAIISTFGGVWLGYAFSDFDVLCGDYKNYRLLENMQNEKNLLLRANTIIKARKCKNEIQVKAMIFIEKKDIHYLKETDDLETLNFISAKKDNLIEND